MEIDASTVGRSDPVDAVRAFINSAAITHRHVINSCVCRSAVSQARRAVLPKVFGVPTPHVKPPGRGMAAIDGVASPPAPPLVRPFTLKA